MDPTKFRPSSSHDGGVTTTNAGAPVWNDNEALTVGPRGPILLEDYHLIEKVAHFARERIPERVVHARGASAKGFFECTHDVSDLTCADFLRGPGARTPVIVRFSTVIHERGSPETIRDPRGFAVKFYTREGNWDLLGNNFPVFFIRDGIKFPDVIHAFKPNPRSHVQEYWRVFDFLSHHPESLHTFFFLFDDVGVPADYRHMEGFGVNTYTFVNKAGKASYVKFHWKPTCGVRCIRTDEEAALVGGRNHSHATGPVRLRPAGRHQDVARGPAAAAAGGAAGAGPERGQLLQRERAAGVRPRAGGAGDLLLGRQDAAVPGVRVRRHAALPAGAQLPDAARERAAVRAPQQPLRRRHELHAPGRGGGLLPVQARAAAAGAAGAGAAEAAGGEEGEGHHQEAQRLPAARGEVPVLGRRQAGAVRPEVRRLAGAPKGQPGAEIDLDRPALEVRRVAGEEDRHPPQRQAKHVKIYGVRPSSPLLIQRAITRASGRTPEID
ncbi:hypothetical protein PVAP13_1KG021100 [Panicum virgatum]|uniref:Catalase core domain-containing protein n=1 Tax=Panicum virgatum TaxID=38727 RepID=A0A8T0X9V2_PANVG|nr:hypothetical protein PVAP13_1KG021100 [Panicum virgatum]